MPSVPVGQFLMDAGRLVLRVTYPTDQELEDKPELAIGVLLNAIERRCFEIRRSGEGAELPNGLNDVLWDWVYCGEPVDKETAFKRGMHLANEWDFSLASMRSRKKGRPIKSRHTAIKALFRQKCLNKSWGEVTRRLCQCGQSHDDQLTLKRCQDNIESEVRHLKTVLKKYDIAFPPARLKKLQPEYKKPQAPETIRTLEESSGALRVPDTYKVPHPAIAILLDGDLLPVIPGNSESEDRDMSYALRVNPWVLGCLPLWFPQIRSEPIGTREECEKRRCDWFDKVFNHFAGPDWQRKGTSDSRKELIARTLLRMYRADRDEEMPAEDKL